MKSNMRSPNSGQHKVTAQHVVAEFEGNWDPLDLFIEHLEERHYEECEDSEDEDLSPELESRIETAKGNAYDLVDALERDFPNVSSNLKAKALELLLEQSDLWIHVSDQIHI